MGLFLSLASLKIIDYTHFNGSVLLIVSPADVYSEKCMTILLLF